MSAATVVVFQLMYAVANARIAASADARLLSARWRGGGAELYSWVASAWATREGWVEVVATGGASPLQPASASAVAAVAAVRGSPAR
jgi:hypothetical protein